MYKHHFLKLILCLSICLGTGFLGSFFTTPAIPTWYTQLIKPVATPPSWVFAPVWTILFIFMGVAAFLIWEKKPSRQRNTALLLFLFQLFLNFSWSFLFFGLRNPVLAFIDILFLWIAILITLLLFHKFSRLAAWLLIPYLLWVSFATYLNYSIVLLN